MRVTSLDPLFSPRSILVLGDSGQPGTPVSTIVDRLVSSGYQGHIVPIVPDCREVCGTCTYKDLQSAPATDLGVVCLPLERLVHALVSMGGAGIKTVICLAPGETETRAEEFIHQERVCSLVRDRGMLVLGPKSLGLINPREGVNASLGLPDIIPGNIAFFSQSGSFCHGFLDLAQGHQLGFSKCVSLGNRSLVSECDMLEFLGNDPDTEVVVGYLEGVSDGPRFLRIAQDVAKKKPVIMVRPGNTPRGTTAALFHRDSVLGFGTTYTTVFEQAGVVRPHDIPSLLALCQGFSRQPLPHGNHVGILTNSGSFGIIAADGASGVGLELPRFSARTFERIKGVVPGYATMYNPVDAGSHADGMVYARIMESMDADPHIHAVVAIITPRQNIDLMDIAQHVVNMAERMTKTTLVCVPGGAGSDPARSFLESNGVPCYREPDYLLYALRNMHDCFRRQRKPYPVEVCYRRDSPKIKKILLDARKQGILELKGIDAQPFLTGYEIPFLDMKLARTAKSAAKMARKMGFPVVLKLASPQEGQYQGEQTIALDVEDNGSVYQAFWNVTEGTRRLWPEMFISGCLVQKQAGPLAKEVSIGLVRDPQFGPLVSFALAGSDGRGREDCSYRIAPLSLEDAHDIIREPWGGPILLGRRGEPGVHLRSLEDMLLTVSQMALDCPEIIEAEFSPVFVDDHQTVVGDVKLVLSPWDPLVPAVIGR
ncbi:acetate--CoA ligase family protein [Desulfoplanes sp.]